MLSKHLSELSFICEKFAKIAAPYNSAIKANGYRKGLSYDDHATDTRAGKEIASAI